MRLGLSISSVGHVALIGWAVLVLPGATRDLVHQQPLPIDIITMEEYTRITAGVREAEPDAEPATPEPVQEAAAADRPTPTPRPREQSAAPEPAPPPPEPRPEPVQTAAIPPEAIPEPTPRPEPAPPTQPAAEAEPAPRPIRADAPLPRPRPATTPQRREPERQQASSQRPQPERQPAAAPQPERAFDPDRIAALLNRVPDAGGTVMSDVRGDSPGLGLPAGTDERLSIGEIDALRRQIARCWNPPIGVIEAEQLLVRIGMELNPDGSLASPPRILGGSSDPVFTIAAEAAMRAVNRCQPYSLPADKYHVWREINVNFDPREILGG